MLACFFCCFVQIRKKPGILLERIEDFSPQYSAYLVNFEGLHLPMPKGPQFSLKWQDKTFLNPSFYSYTATDLLA